MSKRNLLTNENLVHLKRALVVGATHVVSSYKIKNMLDKVDYQYILVMPNEPLEEIKEKHNSDWRRVETVFVVEELINDELCSMLLKSDFNNMVELYQSFGVDIEVKIFDDEVKYHKRITVNLKDMALEIWFNLYEEFESQEIVNSVV